MPPVKRKNQKPPREPRVIIRGSGPVFEHLVPEVARFLKGLRTALLTWAIGSALFMLALVVLLIYLLVKAIR